jgi:hypothetical protein
MGRRASGVMPIEEFKGGSHMIDGRMLDKPVDFASWGRLRALYAARFAAQTPDLRALAAEADVDRVVIGTLQF